MKKITLHTILKFLYSSFFGLLSLCLLGLLILPPADLIRQALGRSQLAFLFVIGGCYAATAFLVIWIYINRFYSRRKAIAAIPKSYIPVEKGDVNKKVRRMIVASLNRSAAIAWDSRPRIPTEPPTVVSEPENRDTIARPAEEDPEKKEGSSETVEKEEQLVTIPQPRPVWGDIAHNGWSTPTSPDLPDLQYITVILELPHLIEAKAVSLAPPDSESNSEPPLPDIRAVDVLQRPAAMGLRDYIGHLTSIGVISSPSIATDFLASYEYARFSAKPLSETQFRDLMKQFAEILRSMNPLTPAILASLDIDPPESDIDDDEVSSTSTPTTARSRSLVSSRSAASRNSSEGTIRTAPSRNPGPNGSPQKNREKFSTAPATPKSKKRVISRTPSTNSFAQSRRPYNGSSADSSESLRSTSQGSVIRLSKTNEEGELPYVLKIPIVR
ncbi:hypothetical protein N431DRAFT_430091 [Stipitochalara longipes BDJ]|nr:hypothetical protein N431DRAFT_430091 [Stipitochalara longipes BDJ]